MSRDGILVHLFILVPFISGLPFSASPQDQDGTRGSALLRVQSDRVVQDKNMEAFETQASLETSQLDRRAPKIPVTC